MKAALIILALVFTGTAVAQEKTTEKKKTTTTTNTVDRSTVKKPANQVKYNQTTKQTDPVSGGNSQAETKSAEHTTEQPAPVKANPEVKPMQTKKVMKPSNSALQKQIKVKQAEAEKEQSQKKEN